MTKKSSNLTYQQWLQKSSQRVSKAFLALGLIYIVSIILYDAFNLITPDMLLVRWTAVSILVALTALLWYAARQPSKSEQFYSWLLAGYVTIGVLFASLNVYIQRGMASRAVFLYIIPLVVAAMLLRRAAIYTVAIVAAAVYSLTAVLYFVNNPSEGYKIELYGEVGFYSLLFFVVAALLGSLVRSMNGEDN